eukprot:Em0016g818a
MLSKVVSENQRNWDENLQKVLFAYRTAVHDSTGYTPFLVMFGRSPNLPVDVMLGRYREDSGSSVPKYMQRTRALMKAAFSDVHKRIKKSHDKQKEDDVLLEETKPPESESNAGFVVIEEGMLPFEPEMVQPAEVLGEVYQEAVEQNEQPLEERQVDQERQVGHQKGIKQDSLEKACMDASN